MRTDRPRIESAMAEGTLAALDSFEAVRARLQAHPTCEQCRKAASVCGTRARVTCHGCREMRTPTAAPIVRAAAVPAVVTRATPKTIGELTGYIVMWGDATRREREGEPGNYYMESFRPGAFREFLAERPTFDALINHDRGLGLGSTRDDFRVWENHTGLAFKLRLQDTPAGQRVRAAAERDEIRGVSPCWNRKVAEYEWHSPICRSRDIVRTRLFEVSIVLDPQTPSFRSGWAALANTETRRWVYEPSIDAALHELDMLEADL